MINVAAVLSHYNYRPYGYETSVLCPFHDDHNPSCRVSMQTGLFYCDSCHAGGTLLELLAGIEQSSLFQAHFLLQAIPGADDPDYIPPEQARKNTEEQIDAAFAFYNHLPHVNWSLEKEYDYFLRRGFTPETLHHFGVKLNRGSTHPLIIPLTEQGEFVGYVMRRVDGEKRRKYKNSPGFPKSSTLVGELQRGIVIVVEGMADVMMLHQFGWTNTTPTMGNLLTLEQAEKLDRYATRIVSGYNNDEAGEKGHAELCRLLPQKRIQRFPFPADKNDFAELSQQVFKERFLSLFPGI